MDKDSTNARMQRPMGSAVHIHNALHRELKIAAAHRNQSIASLIAQAWASFKEKHGDDLHEPTEETELAQTG